MDGCEAETQMRVERTGNIVALTPRVEKFLVEKLRGRSFDAKGNNTTRPDYLCLSGLLSVEIKTLEGEATERLSNVMTPLKERDDFPAFYGEWPIDSV